VSFVFQFRGTIVSLRPMMDRRDYIQRLIAEGEHIRQDFKFAISDSKKIARSLAAFANTRGGRLLVGVKDNGAIAGIRSDEEYYMIESAAQRHCKPEIPFKAFEWDVNGKTVLEIVVEPSDYKLHQAPDKDGIPTVYVRVADKNIMASDIHVRAVEIKQKTDGALLRMTMPVRKILEYLEQNNDISLSRFCRITHIKRNTAKAILAHLLAIDVVEIVYGEDAAYFRLRKKKA